MENQYRLSQMGESVSAQHGFSSSNRLSSGFAQIESGEDPKIASG